MTDDLGRPLVSETDLARIREAFAAVLPGKRGAVLIIADATGVRGHFATATTDGRWRVAAGVGFTVGQARPDGYIAVEASW